jgi:hypothetical protein
MTPRKTSIARGSAVVALAAASVADTASAQKLRGGGGYLGFIDGFHLYRAPQPNQSLPGATSRSPSRDLRRMADRGGRGMRDGAGTAGRAGANEQRGV